jgi:hypothetical protein
MHAEIIHRPLTHYHLKVRDKITLPEKIIPDQLAYKNYGRLHLSGIQRRSPQEDGRNHGHEHDE